MSIFSWLFAGTQHADSNTAHTGTDINPANGLPMMHGIESLDVAGNPYGMDFTSSAHTGINDFSHHNSGFGSFSSGGGHGCGGGFGSGHDW